MTAVANKWNKVFFIDLAERVGATFLGALVTALALVEGTPVDWRDGQAVWTVLGVPVVFALIKGLLANLKDPESGASLVNSPPGPVVQEGGTASILGALGIGLLVLGVILLFTTLLKLFVVSWAVVIAAVVVGVVLLYLDGRRL